MEALVRDLDRICEQENESTVHRAPLLILSGSVAVATIFALGISIGRDNKASAEPTQDPLLKLTPSVQTEHASSFAAEADEPVTVEEESLVFPNMLTETDSRPEVEAAIATAAAEEAHPVPVSSALPTLPSQATPSATQMPAAVTATPAGEHLVASGHQDVLVAQALPKKSISADSAQPGADGPYTLQVISYETPEPARAFATSLQARGHRAFVMQGQIPDRGSRWRVRIGPFGSVGEAEAYRKEFEQREQMNAIVVRRQT